jgi:light-regulated signal transduction histidine kinase (bacteriophytochrome)
MATASWRVLVVEDNPDDRHLYRRLLERGGRPCAVWEAETGAQGIARCRSEPPDCVLLDYRLPDTDGLEFLQAIAADGRPLVPVVMLSSQGSERVAVEAMKRGAQDYLLKEELTARDLCRAVARAIDKVALVRELERRRAELARSNRDLEEFAYAVSHDLQAPLRTIVSFAQLLRKDEDAPAGPERARALDHVLEGAWRMHRMIQDLLDYSRAGSRPDSFGPVALDDVLRQVLADLAGTLRETGGRVEAAPLPTVHGAEVPLRQLVQNLIANALKFRAAAPPVVRVWAERAGKGWELHVADNGIGIEARHLERIFGVFQRLHTREEYPGTGVGLAICRRVAERHGGRIWATSTPGAGTIFHLALADPSAGEEAAPAPERAGTAEPPARAREDARRAGI